MSTSKFQNLGTAPFLDLPVDICHLLFGHLSIPDILNVRQTCKSFHGVTQSRLVWQSLLTTLSAQQIPLPGLSNRSLESLTSAELEHFARKAWLLHRNWTSDTPTTTKKSVIKLDLIPIQQGGAVPTFEFTDKGGRKHLLTVAMRALSAEGPLFDLQCWDLELSSPRCIAHRPLGRYGWFVINKSPDCSAELAIQCPAVELLGIDYSAGNPDSGFYTVSTLPNTTDRLVAFYGPLLVTRDVQNRLYLAHLQNEDNHVELRSYQEMPEQVLEVTIQGDVVIIARLTRLEIFACPQSNETEIYPIAQHIWQWGLDTVSISLQKSRPAGQKRGIPAINILVRFGSRLPWVLTERQPVNLIHHFALLPNSGYNVNAPAAPNNMPYNGVPILRRVIGSPVRLFSNYHMAIGSRGTAVWIDSHTEDYFGRGDCGQRLAASPLSRVLTSEDSQYYEDASEVASMDSSVLAYSANDEWTRVVVDEEEGRIAIGNLDGTVVVNAYCST